MGIVRKFVDLNRRGARRLEKHLATVFDSESYRDDLDNRIRRDIEERGPRIVVEVGGIDRPLLKRDPKFEYIGVDIESRDDCYRVYDRFLVQSIEDKLDVEADMLVSLTLLEHVPNNDAAIQSIFGALRSGGTTHHYIPSKWHPYSIATRAVGPRLQKQLIRVLRPHAAAVTGYPAFFDNCTTVEMSRLFKRAGFQITDVKAFYRASDYFAFFLPAYVAVALFENVCAARDWRLFASGFVISARKPANDGH